MSNSTAAGQVITALSSRLMHFHVGAWQAGVMTQPNEPGDEITPSTPASSAGEMQNATPQWPSQEGSSQAGPSQAGPSQAGSDPSYVTPPAPPAPPAYGPTPQTSNSAIAALVLSIVSWVICPIIPAIIALVFANKAEKEIAVSNGWVTGGGLVTASKIVAWINIGLYAALIAIGILVLILAAVGGAFSTM
jgi:hypothetical protein